MNAKIHKHPTTNRRAPLPGTDTGSLRSRTRRRYPHRDRSHHINATTNQKAPSRNTGGSNHSHLTLNTNTKSCLPIGQAISHPEVPIGQRKLSIMRGADGGVTPGSEFAVRRGVFSGRREKEKSLEKWDVRAFKADRTTSKRIRYGFITIKSTSLIGLNSPRKNTTLLARRFVEPRRTHIPV
ncbi:hypothetical protein TNCV_1851411 [Trichonephila clavipes]|nr:hypothetical protein TNCV_1851411 [Trichonephila clavipes]